MRVYVPEVRAWAEDGLKEHISCTSPVYKCIFVCVCQSK